MYFVKYPYVLEVISVEDATEKCQDTDDPSETNIVRYRYNGKIHSEQSFPTFLHESKEDAEYMLAWIKGNHDKREVAIRKWNEEHDLDVVTCWECGNEIERSEAEWDGLAWYCGC